MADMICHKVYELLMSILTTFSSLERDAQTSWYLFHLTFITTYTYILV